MFDLMFHDKINVTTVIARIIPKIIAPHITAAAFNSFCSFSVFIIIYFNIDYQKIYGCNLIRNGVSRNTWHISIISLYVNLPISNVGLV